MASLSIIIPAYNEEGAIGRVLQSLQALNLDSELIVVDDGSTDRTGEVAAAAGARVIRNAQNMGYGYSLKTGIRHATTDIIVITDADGTYPIDRIPDLCRKFLEGFDMVVGARQGKEYRGSLFKSPMRYVFKLLVEFATGTSIPDINSGLRVFRKRTVLEHFDDLCNGFSFTTTITLVYLLTGRMVTFLPVAYGKRVGTSKVRMVRDTLRAGQFIVEALARYNPIKCFLLLGILSALMGLIGAIWLGGMAVLMGVLIGTVVFGMGLLGHGRR